MDETEQENPEGGGFKLQLVASYLAFGRRAVRTRWLLSVALLVAGICLTVAAAKYLPRTYSSKAVMMAQGSAILDGRDGSNALAGAEDIITRKENLEMLIRDTGLLKTAAGRRPPLLRLKDRISESLFGGMDDKVRLASLVGTLEAKLTVSTEKGDLSIKVQWSDPRSAAELCEAARQSFLKARHSAEISAFEDKMAILDAHATTLRGDIGVLVQQLKTSRDEQLARAREEKQEARKHAGADADPKAAPIMRAPVRRAAEPDTTLAALREKLATLKTQLAGLQSDREKRIRDEQAKYDELKVRLTSSHPEVVTQRERIAVASQIPSEVALLQAETKDLEGQIQQREAMARQSGDFVGGGSGGSARTAADPLPPDVTDLLERDNLDPALSAQLSGAVTTYGALRNDVFSTRVELDTAQAAFNHRYQVIVPAEVPNKADSPKMPAVVGGGLVLALLLALLVPVLAELRTGVIHDRWQVEHLQLPVLAELRLPPHSFD